jgi:hypothetical protein
MFQVYVFALDASSLFSQANNKIPTMAKMIFRNEEETWDGTRDAAVLETDILLGFVQNYKFLNTMYIVQQIAPAVNYISRFQNSRLAT